MFERFNEAARQAVVHAQDEARRLRHGYVGTEHLLLGLLSIDGAARHALEARGLELAALRDKVAAIAPPGGEVVTGQIPFSPGAKKALERSLRAAVEAGHEHIGPGHLLLGVGYQEEGLARRLLEDAGVDPAEVEADVLRLLSYEGGLAPLNWERSPNFSTRHDGARCEQAFRLYGAQFLCQRADDHVGEHVEHGDGWVMRWERE